jgi:putative transposase
MGAHPHEAAGGEPRGLWPRTRADRRRDRQPQRSSRGKRGRSRDPTGWDGGKKVRGIKQHIAVDTTGLILVVRIDLASVQDRDGAPAVIAELCDRFKRIAKLWADAGYAGEKLRAALGEKAGLLEIVKKAPDQKGFAVLPRRWVVERTLAWIARCRRLVRHYEGLHRTARAFILLALIRIMLRRLANPTP